MPEAPATSAARRPHPRWAGALLALVCLTPAVAAADSMDLALSRLRIPGGTARCGLPDGRWCANTLLYERLVSEVAVAAVPPLVEPAASLGMRGFQLSVVGAVTTIAADRAHWIRGSEGDGVVAGELTNTSRSRVLSWNRVALRKGLPFGLEVAGSFGHAIESSNWALGLSLKLALLEGYRSGVGLLPDVAVRGSLGWALGGQQLSLATHSIDLLLSKPLHGAGRWVLSPIAALQLLFLEANSGMVDLAPEVRASCGTACDPAQLGQHVVRFPRLIQQRARLVAGLEAQRDWVVLTVSVAQDILTPDAHAEQGAGTALTAHTSFNAGLGLRY